jgi:hypothetical protein
MFNEIFVSESERIQLTAATARGAYLHIKDR